MLTDPRVDASRRAVQLAAAIRRAAAAIDAQVAPGLAADLVRAATVIAFSAARQATAAHPAAIRRLLAAALSAADELDTLLAMAMGLELLGARGPRLTQEVRQIRDLLRAARRRHQLGAADPAGDSAA
jgi:four helix bundle protein